MAALKGKKRELYGLKQGAREEAAAPEHLDTAGDLMIRELARKQTEKRTTLEEQLKIRQEFEKGSQLEPWTESGLTTLWKLQTNSSPGEGEASKSRVGEDQIANSVKAGSGVSRHEVELGLAEKPGSRSSILYRFALGNRKGGVEGRDDLLSKLHRHPLNRLKEIEEEAFGKKETEEEEVVEGEAEAEREKKKKRKRRRRVKNRKEIKPMERKEEEKEKEEEEEERCSEVNVTSYRPSLWDVKDMRKLCKNEQEGCQIQKLYTIREGKIVQVHPREEP